MKYQLYIENIRSFQMLTTVEDLKFMLFFPMIMKTTQLIEEKKRSLLTLAKDIET